MKKQLTMAVAVLLSAGTIWMTGCKKDDTTPPTITLKGSNTMTQDITDTYTEPGATADDDRDGDISGSISITGTVSDGKVGEYILKYNVSDDAGNSAAEQTRTVQVRSNQLAGTYDVVSTVTGKYAGTYNYNPTITQSGSGFNKIIIGNFGGLGASVVVNATVSGSQITIAAQSPNGMQDPGSISGTGTVSGKNITQLVYTISYTSGGTDNCTDAFSNHQ